MGFFDSLVYIASAATKTVLTPVAIVADTVIAVATGESGGITTATVNSIGTDIEKSIDTILD